MGKGLKNASLWAINPKKIIKMHNIYPCKIIAGVQKPITTSDM